MNLIIFVVLLAIVFVLFQAAEYLDQVLHIGAFAILFLLGLMLIQANVQYKVGETIQTNYSYLPSPLNTSINASSESRQPIYATYNTDWYRSIGILLCAVSVGGFVMVFVKNRRGKHED